MAAEDDTKDLISKYLADMHSLESHGHSAISRQVSQLKDSQHPQAYALVAEFEQLTERHMSQIEERIKALGGNVSKPVQDAASALTGVVAGVYNSVRSEEASKSIRDDYTFLSHVGIASMMLYTTARAVGDGVTAQIAQAIYGDSARAAMKIDDIMPRLVIEELRQDNLPITDSSEDTRKLVHQAWASGGAQSSTRPDRTTTQSAEATGYFSPPE